MTLPGISHQVEYPESDGKPMAETDLHRDWMVHILEQLKYRYRGQQLYVSSNLLVYYEKGDPRKSVAPDDFVVKDCSPHERRTFLTWEEGQTPTVVFEVTSRHTRRHDQHNKPLIYARIGVKEYFLFDPTQDYLRPPLQGFRLRQGKHLPIKANRDGSLTCRELGLRLRLEPEAGRKRRQRLVMLDADTGEVLLTPAEALVVCAEAEKARAEAEKARADAETARADAEQARAERAEAELRILRAKLGIDGDHGLDGDLRAELD